MRTFGYIALAVLILVSCVIAYRLIDPAPPRHIRIAGGPAGGGYHALASKIAARVRAAGVTVDVLETHGALHNLRLLTGPRPVDFAIMQSGVRAPAGRDTSDLRTLATIDLEPVFLLSHPDLDVKTFEDVAKLRVIAGEQGSGTLQLFETIVGLTGTTPQQPILKLSSNRAYQAFASRRGDVLFTVTPVESPWLQDLFKTESVRLLEPQLAPALTRHLSYLTEVTLPPGSINLQRRVPAREVRILATSTALVTTTTMHAATKMLLLQALSEVDHGTALLGTLGKFPSLEYADYAADDEAKRFFTSGLPFIRRHLPYWLANLVERFYALLLPLLTVLIPLYRLIPSWLRRRDAAIIRRWYDRLAEIERGIALAQNDDVALRALAGRLDRMARDLELQQARIEPVQDYFLLRFHIDRVRRELWRAVIANWTETIEGMLPDGSGAGEREPTDPALLSEIEHELALIRRIEQQCESARVPGEFFSDIRDIRQRLRRVYAGLAVGADVERPAVETRSPEPSYPGEPRSAPVAKGPTVTLVSDRSPTSTTEE